MLPSSLQGGCHYVHELDVPGAPVLEHLEGILADHL